MTFEDVKRIMVDTLNLEEAAIQPEATLKDLGVDSIDAVELIMALEEACDVQIADEEAAQLEKVKDVMELLARKCA